MKQHRNLVFIIVGVLLIVGVALAMWASLRSQQTSQVAEGAPATPVKVAPVERGDVVLGLETTGTIVAATEAEVAAKVEQRIMSLPYREGDAVQAGAILARLDDTEARRQMQMAEAEARVAQAQLRDLLAVASESP